MNATLKATILVIDDERVYYDKVKSLLTSKPIDVLWAENRSKALDLMASRHIAVAVLDLRLSDRSEDTSGLDLLEELRHNWPQCKVIVFTNYYLQSDMAVECMVRGAYYYFIKREFSTNPARFIELVERALAYTPSYDEIEDKYPHPIALLYRDYHRNVVAPYLKFLRLIQLSELVVKLSTIICLQCTRSDMPGRLDVRSKLTRPSFGQWFECLQYLLAHDPKNPWVEQIRTGLNKHRQRALAEIVEMRNEWGHGATRPEHEYMQITAKWHPDVLDLLQSVRVFSSWKWFVVTSTKLLPEGRHRHAIVDIGGHSPKFLSKEIELTTSAEADKVYVWDAGTNMLLDLDPFVALFICEQCNQNTVFIYDRLRNDKAVYLDYANGHRSGSVERYRRIREILI